MESYQNRSDQVRYKEANKCSCTCVDKRTHRIKRLNSERSGTIHKRQICGLVFSLINGAVPVKQNHIIIRHP